MPILLFAVLCAPFVIWFVLGSNSYYKRIFSDDHYREIHAWLITMLARGMVDRPDLDLGTAIRTSALINLAYTRTVDADGDHIHISISQAPRYTTRAVGNRVAFLILSTLGRDPATVDLHVTQTSVHHVVIPLPNGLPTATKSADEAVQALKSGFVHLGFRRMEIQGLKP